VGEIETETMPPAPPVHNIIIIRASCAVSHFAIKVPIFCVVPCWKSRHDFLLSHNIYICGIMYV
jgi:hypothetical protein